MVLAEEKSWARSPGTQRLTYMVPVGDPVPRGRTTTLWYSRPCTADLAHCGLGTNDGSAAIPARETTRNGTERGAATADADEVEVEVETRLGCDLQCWRGIDPTRCWRRSLFLERRQIQAAIDRFGGRLGLLELDLRKLVLGRREHRMAGQYGRCQAHRFLPFGLRLACDLGAQRASSALELGGVPALVVKLEQIQATAQVGRIHRNQIEQRLFLNVAHICDGRRRRVVGREVAATIGH